MKSATTAMNHTMQTARGLAHSKTWWTIPTRRDSRKRPGVRQPSGAFAPLPKPYANQQSQTSAFLQYLRLTTFSTIRKSLSLTVLISTELNWIGWRPVSSCDTIRIGSRKPSTAR